MTATMFHVFPLPVILVLIVVYRLYFSPLAKFPGPKIAAATSLYAFYYDVILGGQYIWRIEEMHKKYGPIVRIRPDVLHVNDPEFIDSVFGAPGTRRHKYMIEIGGFAIPGATLGTADHDLHRSRRAALNPYFSKQSIRRLEPILQRTLEKVLSRLHSHRESGEPVKMNVLYNAATNDIISDYCFGRSANNLDREDMNEPLFNAFASGAKIYHLATFVPWLLPVLKFVLENIAVYFQPKNADLANFDKDLEAKIEIARKDTKAQGQTNSATTIFHGILSDDALPESEKETNRLLDEAKVMMGAGTDTTAGTLVAITYHLLANPAIFRRLKAELQEAIPNSDAPISLSQVESLPYLNAVIQEGLRVHSGVCLRQERVAPDEELFYEDFNSSTKYLIPRGTAVGMTAPLLSKNSEFYPSPIDFKPERYLINPRLDKYQITFSRGSRRCIGISLAFSEMYLLLAGIIRKYDPVTEVNETKAPSLELFETIREDIEMAADYVSPAPKKDSTLLRLKVRGVSN